MVTSLVTETELLPLAVTSPQGYRLFDKGTQWGRTLCVYGQVQIMFDGREAPSSATGVAMRTGRRTHSGTGSYSGTIPATSSWTSTRSFPARISSGELRPPSMPAGR